MADFIFFGYNGEGFDPANPPLTEAITGHDFPLLFCGTNYRRTAENHDHVLAAPLDWARFFTTDKLTTENLYRIGIVNILDGYNEVIAAAEVGVLPEIPGMALLGAVARDRRPTNEEEDALLAALRIDDANDLYWIVRGLRHRLAVRLGFFGSLSDDDYQPITISPDAFSAMAWTEVYHDPEEDEDEDEVEGMSEEERAENLARAADALAAAEDALRYADELATIGQAAIDAGIVPEEEDRKDED